MLNTKMIGSKIVEARKKINISQARLAEQLFISPQAVGKWERGESMPDIITLNRLAEILKVDLNYFSENPSLESTEIEAAIPDMTQMGEMPSIKKEKKLIWDMSNGSWVDTDFSGLKNLHEKFSSSNMQKCLFIGSEMSGLLLKNNNVEGCDFSNSDMGSSHIQNSHLLNNTFRNTSLEEAEFSKSYVKGCDFSDAHFKGVNLQKSSYIEGCNFSHSDFGNSRIFNSYLSDNIFTACSLQETEFSESHISECDFTGADFTGVVIKSGGLEKSILTKATWKATSFYATQLADLVFEGTLEDCSFENCSFKKVIFQNTTLINTFFKNNNLKRVQFINCKVDKITYAFLKNGKADLTEVTILTL
ncbi:pentapeptide repeat-containing protein [Chryseobacterium sp. WG23]|uniref:pentapeptide repeat-containing protein n=1 Tax=Chryseobacterium sp. WG23 TaxID=2926910 RepID=UPI00211F2392|nr:pentapeptide repeat-containing protein [Chryseobacterium sp. WG23]MCQ9634282.1 pentapeptide repeat-containing protein [Chryseobacterium sp. WG23]